MGDKKIIVFDLDGVFWDDVQMKLRKHLRTTSTPIAQAFCEAVVLPLNSFPAMVARSTKDLKKGVLVKEAIDAARTLAEDGWEIFIRTSNPTIDTDELERLLAKRKVPIERVLETSSMAGKADMIDGVRPVVVEDNPIVALKAARRGCSVVLLVKDYNRFGSWLASKVNRSITRIRAMDETVEAVRSLARTEMPNRRKILSVA